MLLQKNGDAMGMLLEDHWCAPCFDVCLFSLMKAIEKGWTLSNKGTTVTLTKMNTSIEFGQIAKTKDGIMCGVKLLPTEDLASSNPRNRCARTPSIAPRTP